MATAKTLPPTTPSVELTLSAEEASTLLTILQHVGGCPSTSPRGHANAIHRALRTADVQELPGRPVRPGDAVYFNKVGDE